MMLPILDAFLQIVLRRRGPEDLPDSRFLLLAAAILYVISQCLLVLPVYKAVLPLARVLAVDILVLCAFLWLLLRLSAHLPRYRQTLTALFGTGAILGACMLPFYYWIYAVGPGAKGTFWPQLGMLAVISWSLLVNGHIFSRALSAPLAAGLAVSIGYFFLNFLVVSQVGSAPG
ncbi:MAG: hypothetical protein DYH20_12525 [Gammaproteobacteria bacterium PRO9]|nr:hypothetical protein [Gammaproteobacteria bacterium PRO9]